MSYIKNFEKMMNDFLKEKYPDKDCETHLEMVRKAINESVG